MKKNIFHLHMAKCKPITHHHHHHHHQHCPHYRCLNLCFHLSHVIQTLHHLQLHPKNKILWCMSFIVGPQTIYGLPLSQSHLLTEFLRLWSRRHNVHASNDENEYSWKANRPCYLQGNMHYIKQSLQILRIWQITSKCGGPLWWTNCFMTSVTLVGGLILGKSYVNPIN